MDKQDELATKPASAQSCSTDGLDAQLKQKFVAKQFREAMYQEGKKVQEVTCGCGCKMPLRFAFKCLYCGEFYCQTCAEHHFGKTRAQWIADKAANVKLTGTL